MHIFFYISKSLARNLGIKLWPDPEYHFKSGVLRHQTKPNQLKKVTAKLYAILPPLIIDQNFKLDVLE